MSKLRITIDIDATDMDPSTALEAAQAFADELCEEHGGETDPGEGVSAEELPGKPARMQCADCQGWFAVLDLDDRCAECADETK